MASSTSWADEMEPRKPSNGSGGGGGDSGDVNQVAKQLAATSLDVSAPAFVPRGVAPVGSAAPAASAAPAQAQGGSSEGANPAKDAPATEDAPAEVGYGYGLHPKDAAAEVVVSGGNKDTIYSSATTFEELGLSKELLDGVVKMGFVKPSRIQATALPMIMDSKRPNVIAQAHHGSGKTATFALGMLSRVDPTVKQPQAICLVPTRELALQEADVVRELAQFTGIEVFTAVSGCQRGPISAQVVVGSAGSVGNAIKHRDLNPKLIKILVIDEADVMVKKEGGQGDQVLKVKSKLSKKVQILLFSATFAEKVKKFAKAAAPKALRVTVKREELSLDQIRQFYVQCTSPEDKYAKLIDIYGLLEMGQSIIFVQTRRTAKELSQRMAADGFEVSLLTGGGKSARDGMDNKKRDAIMADFREGRTTVLITTNVLSRGIDIMQVTLVINYDIPVDRQGQPDPSTYIHRIGRTGRFGRGGVAINFVHDRASFAQMKAIEEYFQKPIVKLPDDIEQLTESVQGHIEAAMRDIAAAQG